MIWILFLVVVAIVAGLAGLLLQTDLFETACLAFMVALVLLLVVALADTFTSYTVAASGTVAGKSYTGEKHDIIWVPTGKGGLSPAFSHSPEAYVAIVVTSSGTRSASVSAAKWAKVHEGDTVTVWDRIGGLTGAHLSSRIPDDQ